MTSQATYREGRRRTGVLSAAVVLLALLVAGGLVTQAGAIRAKELGKTKRTPKPDCPGSNCQVSGSVTGFQRSVDGKKGLFRVREPGHIVAWGINLSEPSDEEREFFDGLAGTESHPGTTAGISIIKRKRNRRYRLARKSPVLDTDRFLGQRSYFTLENPLRVRKGHIVALTTLTWLPNFAHDRPGRRISRKNVWIGSRTQRNFPDPTPGNRTRDCEVPSSVPGDEVAEYFFDHSKPHRKVGSRRTYGCDYPRARLLYWAYFVPRN